jgi:hypothetical protein
MSNAAKSRLSDAPAAKAVERDRNIDETMRSVSDELEEQIVLGVLHPRERLVEDDLCERFNLKRRAKLLSSTPCANCSKPTRRGVSFFR